MADHPLRSATDRRLGRPLPHQLTNQTQAHPVPINLWRIRDVSVARYEVLIPVSRGYPSARGRLPTRYSPVRRFPLTKSTEVSLASFSLDLHVLGTPPAFILSQDQTLNENVILRPWPYDLSDLKLVTLCVYNPYPELLFCLVLEIVGNSALKLLTLIHSFLIHVTFRHCSHPVYDSNFYTMKFSMFAAFAVARLPRAFTYYLNRNPLSTTFLCVF